MPGMGTEGFQSPKYHLFIFILQQKIGRETPRNKSNPNWKKRKFSAQKKRLNLVCPDTAMQKPFNLKRHLTHNCAKGNLKMFCHISFMLQCHSKKEEFPFSTAVLLFQRLNKNRQGIGGTDEEGKM